MPEWYSSDLAYIHDQGFSDYPVQSATGILAILQQQQPPPGLIVELGCGSGLTTAVFVQAGYSVLGIDISSAMIDLAKQRVPQAQFQVGSLFHAQIPNCCVVTAIGECLNYLFDQVENRQHEQALQKLFETVYTALTPGGYFIFDIVEAGQVPSNTTVQGFREGPDWFVAYDKTEDLISHRLTRRIITFRQGGTGYQRHEEVHCQRLLVAEQLAEQLREIGFGVNVLTGYANFELPIARKALVAQK